MVCSGVAVLDALAVAAVEEGRHMLPYLADHGGHVAILNQTL
jgi:hypothetical protein